MRPPLQNKSLAEPNRSAIHSTAFAVLPTPANINALQPYIRQQAAISALEEAHHGTVKAGEPTRQRLCTAMCLPVHVSLPR